MKLAIVGSTGLVGKEILKVLQERKFPYTELVLVASKKSKGKEIRPYGIGSCPDPPHGLQLAIRFIESQPPFKRPYFFST